MEGSLQSALVWFRRDLRAYDNAALHHALKAAQKAWCVFVFDRDILDPLPKRDRRVEFIRESLESLDRQLHALGVRHGNADVRLIVRHGHARTEIVSLAESLGVQAVFTNHDDEPFAVRRDSEVREGLAKKNIALHTSKDHVIFERSEILTQTGKPYTVFTPYKNAWLRKLEPFFVKAYPIARHTSKLVARPGDEIVGVPTLQSLGFEPSDLRELAIPTGSEGAKTLLADFLTRIDTYGRARDFPALRGSSYLSVHLRFGTISIRELVAAAGKRIEHVVSKDSAEPKSDGAAVWLSELIWRDFYHQILHHHPRVTGASFKPEYDKIEWEEGTQADAHFEAWCEGRTGYPLVDAAMAQINRTGYMHNRLRMVVASFLTKDLGIDWRRGEAYFALKLNDFDLAANNGGWQWAASTGCDAQPYFRIFNPISQSEKFDADGDFIRRFLPQLGALSNQAIHSPWAASPIELEAAGIVMGRNYPAPIVDHDQARKRTLRRFNVVKSTS
jgi:deoxyribodipyrimidine photo-lyase